MSLIVLVIVTATTISGFLTQTSIYSTLVLASFLGIAAVGQTLVILIGGVDLSVPALISGANLVSTLLSGQGWPFGLDLLFVLVCAALVGAVNGFVIHRFRVAPLIITLATGAMVTGATLGWTRGGQTSGQVPSWLTELQLADRHGRRRADPADRRDVGRDRDPAHAGPAPLRHRPAPVCDRRERARRRARRRPHAAGLDRRLHDERGRGRRRRHPAHRASPAPARRASATPTCSTSLAAVLVGGTSLVGARGDYVRTVLGALILTVLTTLLVGHGAGEALQEILFGVLILVFVGIYGRDQRVRDRV